MKQLSLTSVNHENKTVTMERERFLSEMDQVVPWGRLFKLIEPYDPNSSKGRRAILLAVMLRIYHLQQWYAFIELFDDAVADKTMILNFRRLIEEQGLGKALFNAINQNLSEQGSRVSKGSMVEATIIHAAWSTKNKTGQRDSEKRSRRKNNQFHVGMKIHMGRDVESKVIHSATVASANVPDIDERPHLLRENDQAVFGGAGYTGDKLKRQYRKKASLGLSMQNASRSIRRRSASMWVLANRKRTEKTPVFKLDEHEFRVPKYQFGYKKARYKGLEKNRVQVMALIGLTNLYMQRQHLMARNRPKSGNLTISR